MIRLLQPKLPINAKYTLQPLTSHVISSCALISSKRCITWHGRFARHGLRQHLSFNAWNASRVGSPQVGPGFHSIGKYASRKPKPPIFSTFKQMRSCNLMVKKTTFSTAGYEARSQGYYSHLIDHVKDLKETPLCVEEKDVFDQHPACNCPNKTEQSQTELHRFQRIRSFRKAGYLTSNLGLRVAVLWRTTTHSKALTDEKACGQEKICKRTHQASTCSENSRIHQRLQG